MPDTSIKDYAGVIYIFGTVSLCLEIFSLKNYLVFNLILFIIFIINLVWIELFDNLINNNLSKFFFIFFSILLLSFLVLNIINFFYFDLHLFELFGSISNLENKNLLNEAIKLKLRLCSDGKELVFCYKDKSDLYNIDMVKNYYNKNFIGKVKVYCLIDELDSYGELVEIKGEQCTCIYRKLNIKK